VDAIQIVKDKAQIDDEICTGCGACVDACPEGAMQFVIEGQIVPIEQYPVLAVPPSSSVAEAVGVAVVTTGTMLLKEVARTLARSVGRRLTERDAPASLLPGQTERTGERGSPAAGGAPGESGGHRVRHRRRGK
jgi:ferredoxin